MTDLDTQRPPYVPVGRPVGRFVIALVGLTVLFGALWWSGLVTPRLSVGDQNGSYDSVSGRATFDVDVRNRSPLTVEIRDIDLGTGRATVTSVRVNGRDIATSGHKITGGGKATMVIELTCHPPEGDPAYGTVGLEITVRTPIGLERTRVAGSIALPPACIG